MGRAQRYGDNYNPILDDPFPHAHFLSECQHTAKLDGLPSPLKWSSDAEGAAKAEGYEGDADEDPG